MKDISQIFLFPYIKISEGQVVYVNGLFSEMVEYATEDLMHKTVRELMGILRTDFDFPPDFTGSSREYYMFTKQLDVIEVRVNYFEELNVDGIVYIFEELPDSRLEQRFLGINKLLQSNTSGVSIFGVLDARLLRTNGKYFQNFNEPFQAKESCIGHTLDEISPGWTRGPIYKIWTEVIESGETYYKKESMYLTRTNEETYWDVTIIPIEADGRIKYVIEIVNDVTEGVLNRKRVEEQKKQLEAIIENMSEGLTIVDNKGNHILMNKETRKWLDAIEVGEVGDAIKSCNFYDEDGNRISQENIPMNQLMMGNEINNRVIRMEYGDKFMYFNMHGTPIFDDNGNFSMGILCSKDITKEQMQANLIRTQRDQLASIIENISDGLMVIDRDRNIIAINKQERSYYPGLEPMNRLEDGVCRVKCYNESGMEISVEELPVNRALKGEFIKNYNLVIQGDYGLKYLNINAVPIYDENSEAILAVTCSRDITQMVERERQLRNQNESLYNIINTFDLPIVRLSYPDFKIIGMNKSAYKEIAKSAPVGILEPGSILGRDAGGLLPTFHELSNLEYMKRLKETKNIIHIRDVCIPRSDENYYYNITYQPLLNINNEIEEVLVISTDVTSEIKQRKELERVLNMQEEFFSYIAHEFKTPLTVIYSAIQVMELLCKNELSEKTMGFIKKIRQSSLQQLRLVNNLLDITRAEAGYLKINRKSLDIVALTKAIVSSVTLYAEGKGVKLIFDSSLREKKIMIDDEKFERIILNLLSNAIKFTPEGKNIKVELSVERQGLCIKVKDEGIGIPKDKHKVIFDRFGQVNNGLVRNAEGTGIGLCLVKMLVNSLGGEIHVESEEGVGTTFIVYVPDIAPADDITEKLHEEIIEDRLVQSMNIEFSNIYM